MMLAIQPADTTKIHVETVYNTTKIERLQMKQEMKQLKFLVMYPEDLMKQEMMQLEVPCDVS